MPNHITNILKAAPIVLEALRGNEGLVDFSSIIPRPKSLDDITFDGTDDLVNFLCGGERGENSDIDKVINHLELSNIRRMLGNGDLLKRDDKWFENFVLMLRNKRKYGFVGWYDFDIEKWGTKWNAYDIESVDGGIQFNTAWSAPHPVISQLAQMFPNEKIEHLWADEDIGSNLGHRIYTNGTFYDISILDKIGFALQLHEDYREFYQRNSETGYWEHKEEE